MHKLLITVDIEKSRFFIVRKKSSSFFFHPRTYKRAREGLLRTFRRPEKLSMEICYGNEKLE